MFKKQNKISFKLHKCLPLVHMNTCSRNVFHDEQLVNINIKC